MISTLFQKSFSVGGCFQKLLKICLEQVKLVA